MTTIQQLIDYIQVNNIQAVVIDGKEYDQQAAIDYLNKWPQQHNVYVQNMNPAL